MYWKAGTLPWIAAAALHLGLQGAGRSRQPASTIGRFVPAPNPVALSSVSLSACQARDKTPRGGIKCGICSGSEEISSGMEDIQWL